MKVINFGSLNIDYVYQVDHFSQPGETCASLDFQICSGEGLNQSVALAKAGQRTYHAGFVGGDGESSGEAFRGERRVHGVYPG